MFLNHFIPESADRFKEEKEDMIIKSENNSTWSSEEDVPPQIIVNSQQQTNKLEPLLEPLKFKPTSKA